MQFFSCQSFFVHCFSNQIHVVEVLIEDCERSNEFHKTSYVYTYIVLLLLEIHRVFLPKYLCFLVVTTIIFHSEGVEIIQDSKALHRLCGQRGAYDSKRANKCPLISFSGNFYWFSSLFFRDIKHLECK